MLNRSAALAVLSICLLTITLVSTSWGAQFQDGESFPVGLNPVAVASGDFNKDGKLDLIVANSGQSSVDVLLGNGDGIFQQPVQYKAGGPSPKSLAIGDFNGDGNLDVAVASNIVVAILLGKGDGTFQLPLQAAASGTSFLATADFNHDGILDLVYLDGEVELALGNGDGTFQPSQSFFLTAALFSLSIADFNGDGNLDLAVVLTGDPGYVAVLIGTGTGSFLPGPAKYSVGHSPQSVTVGDFNGDGRLDLAISDAASNHNSNLGSVSVLFGNGDGTFQPFKNYPLVVDFIARTIATADFNKDGKTDLVVVNDVTNNVTELLGKGDGTFQKSVNWSVGNQPEFVLVGDFNGDGIPDLVTANSGSNDVTVLLGETAGAFEGARDVSTGTAALLQTFPLFGATGDFNEDGIVDLVATNPGAVNIMLGQGKGKFAAPVTYKTALTLNPDVVVADLNGDSHLDIVEVNQSTGNSSISVLLGNGDGTFHKAVNYAAGTRSESVAVADFNGDGIPDLAVANAGYPQWGNISLLFGNGDGTFQPAITISDGIQSPWWIIAADFNGDGKQDLMDISLGTAIVSLGNGDGTFQSPIRNFASVTGMFGVVADFNGDGKLDLVTASGVEDVTVSLGNGDGTFQTPTYYVLGLSPVAVAAADFNGDGVLDIAVADKFSSFSILRGNGDGTFTVTHGGKVGSTPTSVALGDFNNDGHPDLAIFNVDSNEASVLMNTGK